MLHAEQTVTVGVPIERLFDFLADGQNNTRWRENVVDIERTTEEAGEGATFRQVMKGPGGRSIRGDYRITRYERPLLMEFDVVAGPARPSGRFRLEEVGAGRTKVTFTLDFQPRGVTRLLTPMIRKQMTNEVTALKELPDVLEQG